METSGSNVYKTTTKHGIAILKNQRIKKRYIRNVVVTIK